MNDLSLPAAAAPDLFAAGGRMGALMRDHDWSGSPLGPPESWPAELRAHVGLILQARQPMFVAWGPELGFLYNDAYAPILGAKHPAGLGRPFADVWSDIWPQFVPIVDRTLAGEAQWFETLPIRMERHGFPEDTWFSFSYTPVRDSRGRTAGMFCACVETTAQVLAAQRLRRSEEENRAIVEGATDHAIFATDSEGTIRSWSPGARAIFGWSAEEVVGDSAARIFTPEDRADGALNWELRTAVKQGWAPDERWHLRRDGSRIFMTGSVRPLRSDDGRITGFVKVARDETERRAVFEALAASEARTRGILDSMGEGFALLDRDYRILDINAEGLRLEARPREELLGRTHWEAYPGTEESELGRLYKKAMVERLPVMLDHHYAWPTGGEAWLEMRAYPVADGLAIFYRDVTDRKRAEIALGESDENYRFAAELNPQVTWTALPDGQLDRVSTRWREWTGTSGLGDTWADGLHPDDRPLTFKAWGQSVATGEAYDIEHRVRFLNGEYRWARSRAFPRLNDKGAVVRWYGTTEDVHERKSAQDVLAANERRFREMADDAPVILWTTDPDGRCTYLNRPWYAFTGQTEAEAEGFGWLDATHPDDRPRTEDVFKDANARQAPFYVEYRLRRAGGGYSWAIDMATPRFSPGGAYLGYVGSVIDITERKRAEEAQRDSEARFRTLVDTVPSKVWFADASGALTYFNARWYAYTGLTPEQSIGDGWADVLHPDDVARTAAMWEEARARGQSYVVECRYRRRDGAYRWFVARAEPLRDEGGPIRGWFGTSTDIDDRKQAEAALLQSEQRFRDIADSIDQMIWSTTPDGRHDYFNRRWYEYTGVPDGSTDGEAWNEVFHPEDQPKAWEVWSRSLQTGEPYHIEYRLRHRSGQYRWVLGRALPVRDEAGRITRWYGTCTDIHEQKMVEARLSSIMDAVPVGIMMAEAPSGRLVQTNRYMETLLRRPVRHTAGAPDYSGREAYRMDGRQMTPGDWPIQRVLQSGAPAEEEVRFKRGDDTFGWLRIQAAPVRDAAGQTVGAVAGVTDVNEIVQAREVLARSREELERQAEQLAAERDRMWRVSRELMLVARFDGIIEAVNPAWTQVLGWSRDELIGRSFMDLIHPDDLEPTAREAASLGEGLATPRFENRYRAKDGGYRWLSWTAVPEAERIFATARDMTAEKDQAETLARIEEQLRQAQKMEAVGQLTGGVAHDFNNLLQIVVGNLELLNRSLPADAGRQRRSVENAMSGAKRAVTLTQRLLAFSRRQPLDPKPVSVNRLVAGMSELLSRALGETIEIETVLAAGLWQVEVDANQLENAILNLAVNARDAMPEGGKLTIETANTRLDESYVQQNVEVAPGQYVVICVSDTGTGMDKAVAARVFEPFFTTKEVGKGTGLGLSQVYGFVKQSGGHVKIYSERGGEESRGTTVKIYLPRYLGDAAEDLQADEPAAPGGDQGETVLVVEDDPDVRAYTVEVLSELGYRVLEAGDAHAALRLLRDAAVHCDLLFTDVVLPGGMNGEQLAAAAHEARPGLRVLFTTGYARNAIVHHGRLDPGVRLITKPFTYADLAARVRDVLDESATVRP